LYWSRCRRVAVLNGKVSNHVDGLTVLFALPPSQALVASWEGHTAQSGEGLRNNDENQFLKARLLALEKSFLKITYNVDKDKEPGSSVYKAKRIDKAAAFHASEQSNKSNLRSINTELLNTSHDNSLARHNNNGQCNADDLNNNQIDLANDDAVFSPK
jgi:hypothetical protein